MRFIISNHLTIRLALARLICAADVCLIRLLMPGQM